MVCGDQQAKSIHKDNYTLTRVGEWSRGLHIARDQWRMRLRLMRCNYQRITLVILTSRARCFLTAFSILPYILLCWQVLIRLWLYSLGFHGSCLVRCPCSYSNTSWSYCHKHSTSMFGLSLRPWLSESSHFLLLEPESFSFPFFALV